LNINEYIIELLNQKAVKEEEINSLESNMLEIPPIPNIEIFKLKSKLKSAEIYEELKLKYINEYQRNEEMNIYQLMSSSSSASANQVDEGGPPQSHNNNSSDTGSNSNNNINTNNNRTISTRSQSSSNRSTTSSNVASESKNNDNSANNNQQRQYQRQNVEINTSFESSSFSDQLNNEYSKIKLVIEREFDSKFIEAYDQHEKVTAIAKNEKIKMEMLKKEQKRYIALEAVSTAINTAMSMIVTKIKAAVFDYPVIRTKLQQRFELPSGEILIDPYTSDDLTGIYGLLVKEYGKATLILFCNMLMDLLNYHLPETAKDRPEIAVNEINRQLKSWEQLNLFDYMDKDKLFTISLLKSFPQNSEARVKGVMEVFHYVHKCEKNEVVPSTDMPIYNYLTSWLTEKFIKAREFGKHSGVHPKQGYNNNQSNFNNTPQNNNYNNNKVNNGKGGHYQQAANAEAMIANQQQQGLGKPPSNNAGSNNNNNNNVNTRSTMNGNSNHSNNNKSKGNYIELTPAKNNYNREVTRDDKVFVIDNHTGTKKLYTATKIQCLKCNEGKQPHDKPRCYIGMCNKCNLYGHRDYECRQQFVSSNENAHFSYYESESL
jgi:hypothetical protein